MPEMIKSGLLELSEEKIGRGIEHINRLKDENELVYRICNRDGSFVEEVEDLFYYFSGFGQYLKTLIMEPQLGEEHDSRLCELEEALKLSDMITEEEEKIYFYLRGDTTMPTYDILRLYEIYGGLRGELNLESLYAQHLQRYISRKTFSNIFWTGLPLSIGGWITLSGLLNDNQMDDIPGLVAGSSFVLLSVVYTLLDKRKYVPTSYHALHAKAERTDRFIEQYMR